jgi:hypothetical protein
MNTADAIASFEHVSVQERVVGTCAGLHWCRLVLLTPQEAVELAREWRKRYGAAH